MAQLSYPLSLRAAIAGLLFGDTRLREMLSATNQDVVNMPFGVMVAQGATFDGASILPVASPTPVFKGVIAYGPTYERQISGLTDDSGNNVGDLTDTGLAPKANLDLVSKGMLWVPCEEVTKFGDRLRVRVAQNSGVGQLGAFRKAAVSGQTWDVTAQVKAVGVTVAAPAGLAWGYLAPVEIDMMNVQGAAD